MKTYKIAIVDLGASDTALAAALGRKDPNTIPVAGQATSIMRWPIWKKQVME
jgi:hypothetical protein